MKLLTKSMQETISRQMSNKARDIDVCLIYALDGSMPKEYLLDCLMFYQNRDGGFGNALHIDNYNKDSSVYQVYEAFRLLDMLGFDAKCDLELYTTIVNKAGNYLFNRVPPVKNRWNPNVLSNNTYPHAIDFTFGDEANVKFGMHPTMALVGYSLLLYNDTKAYYKKAYKMANELIDEFLNKNSLTRYEYISVNSFINSLTKCNLFTEKLNEMKAHLIELAKDDVSMDFDDLDAIHPLDCSLYVSNPELDEKKNLELDYIIDNIRPHGLWDHLNSWGYDTYAEEDSAKLKWIGAETVNNYYLLKLFGRIE